jgi:Tol biopolymer transport system component
VRIARFVLLSSAVALSLAIGVAGARDLSGYSQIVAVRADGSGTKNLTHWRFDDDWPAVSPDGRKIAFVRTTSEHGLWIMNADGSGQRKLAMVSGSDELAPGWSPDDKHIAFVAMTPCEPYFCSDLALWVVRPDGSGLGRLPRM